MAIKVGGRILFINLCDVVSVQAKGKCVWFQGNGSSYLLRESISAVTKALETHGFIRIHRSTIVNINEICEILPLLGGDYSVVLRDKTRLTLSRRYRLSFDEFLRGKLVSLPKSV